MTGMFRSVTLNVSAQRRIKHRKSISCKDVQNVSAVNKIQFQSCLSGQGKKNKNTAIICSPTKADTVIILTQNSILWY